MRLFVVIFLVALSVRVCLATSFSVGDEPPVKTSENDLQLRINVASNLTLTTYCKMGCDGESRKLIEWTVDQKFGKSGGLDSDLEKINMFYWKCLSRCDKGVKK